MITEFEKFVEKFGKVKDDFIAQGKTALEASFKEIFDKHPELLAITWVQYTPYFNDGDACIFSIGEIAAFVKGGEYDEIDDPCNLEPYEGDDLSKHKELNKDFNKLRSIMNKSEVEEILEQVFGDHVQVAVLPDRIETFDYEHD